MFNNRKLTELETKFREGKQCIACGVKVQVTPKYKKINGKSVKIGEIWPFECKDCSNTRKQTIAGHGTHSFGSARASVQHEFIRRIGGNFKYGD